ncbi:MAG: uroporphyrinogen-III C-methyltransferase [Alphaproteobacteria bacterium]|nr:uroporphyrinogen-III C-methyltransferase [Alphaproteobacteria bacterium]MBV9692654.1 uroporphyrinogen-III C-methyltransferase [Alphaproteobacteria bacterium]
MNIIPLAEVRQPALPRFAKGSVWLVGAGPGDPGLITVLGLRALEQADVVLYDALANEALLDLARPGAQRIFAGKRAGSKSIRQDQIIAQMIAFARRKKRVLRLKGGDPFVFGRGAEEALALAEAHIPFRVVPGVTAGIGGLAYAGIPLTHRDTNHAVTFITGHGVDGGLPDLDWRALSKGASTLVFYMARTVAGEIAAKLIAAGRDANEPAAVIANASLPDQTVAVTTVAGLGPAAAAFSGPTMLVVGANVGLRERLAWTAKRSPSHRLESRATA